MGRKSVRLNVMDAEIGWSGKYGGRTVEFDFYDDDKGKVSKVGTLQISQAALRWKSAYKREWKVLPIDELDEIFSNEI